MTSFHYRGITLLLLLTGLSFLFNACEDGDACNGITCVNGNLTSRLGVCACECDNGYGGPDGDCAVDLCDTVQCINGSLSRSAGGCACDCELGYEGDSCLTISRNRFIANNYSVTETCVRDSCGTQFNLLAPDYTSSITAGDSLNEVVISNFGNVDNSFSVTAEVTGSDLNISTQTFSAFDFEGAGVMNDSETILTITYTIADSCDIITCTATYVK